jgi:hypothetical protein
MFKTISPYDYIQDNFFPRQQTKQQVYLFKMLIEGDGCGVHLMR